MSFMQSHHQTFNQDLKKIGLLVLGLHVFLGILAIYGLPDFQFKKKPDLTVELSVLAPSKGAEQTSISQPRSIAKPEPQKTLPKDKDGTETAKTVESSSPPASSSVAGPANAQTLDADYKAAYLKNPKPPYPPLAVKMRLEGKVTLRAEVLPDGKAGRVAIESSSGHEILDQSALQTVKQWQFTPARKDGVIIPQVVRIPINFNLKSR
jgi:protein TonB